jgi:hypothetical protein
VSRLCIRQQRPGRLLDGVVIDDTNLFNNKLQEWEDYYNYHRPHGALGGQTPYERLTRKHTQTSPIYRSRTPASVTSVTQLVRSFLSRVKCGLRPPPLVAGPVRSSLRSGRPARRRRMSKGPMTEEETPQATGPRAVWSCCCLTSGPAFSAADPGHGQSPPVKAMSLAGSRLRVSLDRRRSPGRIGHYEGRPSE